MAGRAVMTCRLMTLVLIIPVIGQPTPDQIRPRFCHSISLRSHQFAYEGVWGFVKFVCYGITNLRMTVFLTFRILRDDLFSYESVYESLFASSVYLAKQVSVTLAHLTVWNIVRKLKRYTPLCLVFRSCSQFYQFFFFFLYCPWLMIRPHKRHRS